MAPPGKFTYKYPRPALTAETVVVAEGPDEPRALLILRKHQPFQGQWALPGGFVDEGETLDQAAARELQEETSIDPASVTLHQVGTVGAPDRDPRGWSVGVGYTALVPTSDLGIEAADDAAEARWWPIARIPLPLASDHQLVTRASFLRLASGAAADGNVRLAAQLREAAQLLDPDTPPAEGDTHQQPGATRRAAPSPPGEYSYQYSRPALTVDAILVSAEAAGPKVLLIQRKNDPFAGDWAFPGGFVDEMEPLDQAAARELREETSVDPAGVDLAQVGVFDTPGRDPRGWVVGVVYAALVPSTDLGVKAGDDAAAARWWPVDQVPLPLATDHQLILRRAFRQLADQAAAQGRAEVAGQLAEAARLLDGPWQRS